MIPIFTTKEEKEIKKMNVLDRVLFEIKIMKERKEIITNNNIFEEGMGQWVKSSALSSC